MGRLLMTEELIDKCLNNYTKSGLTRKNYRVNLIKIKKHIEEKNISLDELKHEDIRNFFNEYEKKYATESVNQCKNALTFFVKYLVKNDYLDDKAKKLISDLEREYPESKEKKYLNIKQIEYLLGFLKDTKRQRGEQVQTFDFLRSRDLFLFTLLTTRGLRATETARLELEHFDIEKKTIFIPKKNRKNGNNKYGLDLTIILDDEMIDLYEKYLIEREKISVDNNYVFIKPNGNPLFIFKDGEYTSGGVLSAILKRRIKQVNMYHLICNTKNYDEIEDISIHSLRHTSVYYLRKGYGLDNYEMARILGQRNVESQRRYTHINEKDLREKLNGN